MLHLPQTDSVFFNLSCMTLSTTNSLQVDQQGEAAPKPPDEEEYDPELGL